MTDEEIKAAAEEEARKAAEEEAANKNDPDASGDGNKDDQKSDSDPKSEDKKDDQKDQNDPNAAEIAARDEELRKLREKLSQFEGIDPAKAKKALEELTTAQKKAREAEKIEAERKGEIDRLKQMMAEDNQKVVDELNAQIEDLKSQKDSLAKTIEDMTVGQRFAESKFIDEQLVLTPKKTRQLYGNHFTFEDGSVVAYDRPVGSEGAQKLVDRAGKPLSFDVALEKIVSLDPEFDRLKRATLKPGANSKTEDKTVDEPKETSALSKIRAGLASLK